MTRTIRQKRYSEAFKRMVLDEIRQGKWSTPSAAARAYGIMSITVSTWMDSAGLTHLRSRAVEVKTLGEVSELQRIRKENRQLREQLIDEILDHRADAKALEAAGSEFGFVVADYRKKALNTVPAGHQERV